LDNNMNKNREEVKFEIAEKIAELKLEMEESIAKKLTTLRAEHSAPESLARWTVPELHAEALALGIKRRGVGWPSCCPPRGNKKDIIAAIERAALVSPDRRTTVRVG
jgi:hypothetical protein